jgi:hypothetical protein
MKKIAAADGPTMAISQPDDALRSLGMLVVNVFGLLSAEIVACTVAKHLPWLRREPV